MHVIIAGCGRVGSQLATLLSHEGHNVVVIDRDPASFERLERPFNGLTLAGIAFDLDILRDAGIEGCDAFIALTNYDNTNIMAAEIAVDVFKVPRVFARVYNPDKELTYRSMGIDYLSGSTLLAEAFHRELTWRGMLIHAERGEGMCVVEMEAGSVGGDISVADIGEPGKVRLLGLMRDEKPLYFSRDTCIVDGDHLLLAVDLKQFNPEALLLQWRPEGARRGGQAASPQTSAVREERQKWKVIVAGCGRVMDKMGYPRGLIRYSTENALKHK